MTDTPMYHDTAQMLIELAKNPIVELIIAWAAVEKLQANGVIGPLAAGTMEAGIVGIITAQQIAPLLPSIIQGGGAALGGIAKMLPALAAA